MALPVRDRLGHPARPGQSRTAPPAQQQDPCAPMAIDEVTERLKAEILGECEDDLVQFCEIDWMAKQYATTFNEQRELIRCVIIDLVASGLVEIGDAVNTCDFVGFRPWPEQDKKLRERLEQVTSEIIFPKLGDGFWLAGCPPREDKPPVAPGDP